MTNNVPLSIKIGLGGTIYTDLNDGTSFRLSSYVPAINKKIAGTKLYEDAEETLTFQIVGSGGYQDVQTNLRKLSQILEISGDKERGSLSIAPTLTVTTSGGVYAAALSDIQLNIPDDTYMLQTYQGIINAELTYKRTPFYTSGQEKTSISGSIPNIFTISGFPFTDYSSPIRSYMIGPLAHAYQRSIPDTYIITNNNPGLGMHLKDLDISSNPTAYAPFSQVTGATAKGGTFLRIQSGQVGTSGVFYSPFIDPIPLFNGITPFSYYTKFHTFAAVRCSGTWELNTGIVQNIGNDSFARSNPVYGNSVYVSDISNPTVMYTGTITSPAGMYGIPTFKVNALSTSGYFDIDYIAYVGDDSENVTITKIPAVSLSGLGKGAISYLWNPAPGASQLQGTNDVSLDGKPHYMYAKVNGSTMSVTNDVLNANEYDTIVLQHLGDDQLYWKSYYQYSVPNFTQIGSFFDTDAIDIMILATGSGGAWSYRTISGAALNVFVTASITQSYPYLTRI